MIQHQLLPIRLLLCFLVHPFPAKDVCIYKILDQFEEEYLVLRPKGKTIFTKNNQYFTLTAADVVASAPKKLSQKECEEQRKKRMFVVCDWIKSAKSSCRSEKSFCSRTPGNSTPGYLKLPQDDGEDVYPCNFLYRSGNSMEWFPVGRNPTDSCKPLWETQTEYYLKRTPVETTEQENTVDLRFSSKYLRQNGQPLRIRERSDRYNLTTNFFVEGEQKGHIFFNFTTNRDQQLQQCPKPNASFISETECITNCSKLKTHYCDNTTADCWECLLIPAIPTTSEATRSSAIAISTSPATTTTSTTSVIFISSATTTVFKDSISSALPNISITAERVSANISANTTAEDCPSDTFSVERDCKKNCITCKRMKYESKVDSKVDCFKWQMKKWVLGVILTVVFLVLIAVIVLTVCCLKRRRSKEPTIQEEKSLPPLSELFSGVKEKEDKGEKPEEEQEEDSLPKTRSEAERRVMDDRWYGVNDPLPIIASISVSAATNSTQLSNSSTHSLTPEIVPKEEEAEMDATQMSDIPEEPQVPTEEEENFEVSIEQDEEKIEIGEQAAEEETEGEGEVLSQNEHTGEESTGMEGMEKSKSRSDQESGTSSE